MPMIVEIVVAMLACARLGVIHSIVVSGRGNMFLKSYITCHIHHNLFISLLLGSKLISLLAILSVLY